MTKILLLDDDPNILHSLKRALGRTGWETRCFSDSTVALEDVKRAKLNDDEYDLILSDYRMPVMDGVTFFEHTKKLSPDTIRIILSGQSDLDAVMDAINRAEIFRFICKPCHSKELINTLNIAIKHSQLLKENNKLANMMRAQHKILNEQQDEFVRLEKVSPGITKVNTDDSGAIIMDVEQYFLNQKQHF